MRGQNYFKIRQIQTNRERFWIAWCGIKLWNNREDILKLKMIKYDIHMRTNFYKCLSDCYAGTLCWYRSEGSYTVCSEDKGKVLFSPHSFLNITDILLSVILWPKQTKLIKTCRERGTLNRKVQARRKTFASKAWTIFCVPLWFNITILFLFLLGRMFQKKQTVYLTEHLLVATFIQQI